MAVDGEPLAADQAPVASSQGDDLAGVERGADHLADGVDGGDLVVGGVYPPGATVGERAAEHARVAGQQAATVVDRAAVDDGDTVSIGDEHARATRDMAAAAG